MTFNAGLMTFNAGLMTFNAVYDRVCRIHARVPVYMPVYPTPTYTPPYTVYTPVALPMLKYGRTGMRQHAHSRLRAVRRVSSGE